MRAGVVTGGHGGMFDLGTFDEAMQASRAAAARGDWETALDAAETAIAAQPDDLDARSELAVALYHNAQYARAIVVLNGLHAQCPDDLTILAYLARAYEGNHQPIDAATTLLALAEHATAQHLFNDALEAFEEAVRLAPTDERARIGLAEVLVALGERLRAAEQCVVVAHQRFQAGDAAGAQEALDEALDLDPNNLQARRLQTELTRAAPAPFAAADGDSCLPHPATPASAWNTPTLEELPHTTGTDDAATDSFVPLEPLEAAHLREFAPVTPLDTTGCADEVVQLVETSAQFIEQNLVWAALDACYQVIRIDPEYLPIHLRLSEIYEREGHVGDALAKYRTLIDTYMARACPTDAIMVYQRMIELAPDDLDARTQLVALLRSLGRTDDAATEAISVATTAFRMGQTERALTTFQDIHTWAMPSAALYIEHGRALLKLERWNEAAAQWKQATDCEEHNVLALALHVLALALVEPPSATLWNTFAALLSTLSGDEAQLAAVQSEYRLALLLADKPVLHLLLGMVQQAAGQDDLALMSFEQALGSIDDQPALAPVLVHQAMVRSYVALADREQALEHLLVVQRLLNEQPVPPSSPPAFARPLTPDETQRMIAALQPDTSHATEAANPPTVLSAPAQPTAADTAAPVDAPSVDTQPVPATPLRVERPPTTTATSDAAAMIAAWEASAHRCAHAGRYEQALTELYRAAVAAWMVNQPAEAVRLVEQGVAWAPQLLQAWQQQVLVFLLLDDVDRAAAAQRELLQLALMEHPQALNGSAHQLLVLVPNDAEAQSLIDEQAGASPVL